MRGGAALTYSSGSSKPLPWIGVCARGRPLAASSIAPPIFSIGLPSDELDTDPVECDPGPDARGTSIGCDRATTGLSKMSFTVSRISSSDIDGCEWLGETNRTPSLELPRSSSTPARGIGGSVSVRVSPYGPTSSGSAWPFVLAGTVGKYPPPSPFDVQLTASSSSSSMAFSSSIWSHARRMLTLEDCGGSFFTNPGSMRGASSVHSRLQFIDWKNGWLRSACMSYGLPGGPAPRRWSGSRTYGKNELCPGSAERAVRTKSFCTKS